MFCLNIQPKKRGGKRNTELIMFGLRKFANYRQELQRPLNVIPGSSLSQTARIVPNALQNGFLVTATSTSKRKQTPLGAQCKSWLHAHLPRVAKRMRARGSLMFADAVRGRLQWMALAYHGLLHVVAPKWTVFLASLIPCNSFVALALFGEFSRRLRSFSSFQR